MVRLRAQFTFPPLGALLRVLKKSGLSPTEMRRH